MPARVLILANDRIEARFDLSRGCRLAALVDRRSGRTVARQDGQILVAAGERCELSRPGVCTVRSVRQGPLRDPHLGPGRTATVRLRLRLDGAALELERRIDLPDGAGAVRILDTWHARSPLAGTWYSELIRLRLPGRPRWTVYDWFTCSDQTNHRLIERSGRGRQRGLLCTAAQDGDGVFVWKEGPAPDSRPVKGDWDFAIGDAAVAVVGAGFDRAGPEAARRCDAVVVGVLEDARSLLGLRRWQQVRYHRESPAAEWVANSWPAFHLAVDEAKIRGEIAAAAASGFEVVTIDDGWFSTFMGEIDRAKFPGGMDGVAAAARDAGVQLGLWMDPLGMDTRDPRAKLWDGAESHDTVTEGNRWNWVARTSDFIPCETYISEGVRGYFGMDLCNPGYYAHIRDRILAFARDQGIRRFKFDLYQLSAYHALSGDAHLHYEAYRRLLDELKAAGIVIEMDVTRGNRPCFDCGLDYGRLFLENRGRSLKDHRWYQPWISLANLWDAARLAPAQLLELEVFPQLDEHPVDYVLATALCASPLYFGSLAAMPVARLGEIRAWIDAQRELRSHLHAGLIVPVGERPKRDGWSGFASVDSSGSGCWLVAYRNGPGAPAEHVIDLRHLGVGLVQVAVPEPYGWRALRCSSL